MGELHPLQFTFNSLELSHHLKVIDMKKLLLFLCIGISLSFSSSISGLEKESKEVDKIPDEAIQVAKDSNTFALQLYNQLPNTENICFSPYSISSAFAMVYTGAKTDTQKEMAKILHFPSSDEELDKGWFWLNKFLTFYPSNASDDIRLRAANSLWVQTNFPVLPLFRERMSKYFSGSFRFVDFKTQIETARATINAWVKQSTFGKISDILSEDAINNTTRMVLVSALYLKAKWKNPFDIHMTSQQPFFSDEDVIETVSSMSQTAHFPYLDTPEAAILEMPYVLSRKEGPEFSMLIILPHQKEELSNIEKELTSEKITQWMNNSENTRVILTIPKFKIVQSNNLSALLIKLGMELPFSDDADFSGISNVKGLKIGNVSHKVYLAVDEKGSEAAAATAISMNTTAFLEKKPPVIFQADHPFVYIIIEKMSGTILFMGRVVDPNRME